MRLYHRLRTFIAPPVCKLGGKVGKVKNRIEETALPFNDLDSRFISRLVKFFEKTIHMHRTPTAEHLLDTALEKNYQAARGHR